MGYNVPLLTLSLPAAAATGIAASQSGTAGTALTLSGSLVSGGVANLVVARRVIVTSAGDDSAHTFTLIGTDRYSRSQTEILQGANGVAQSTKDFLTVTSITPNNNTTSTVTAGTNATGSTAPYIVDTFINPGDYGAAMEFTGTVTSSIEVSYTDLTNAKLPWDLASNTVTWYIDPNFNALTANAKATITGPVTMIRQTNSSGTGTATTRLIVPFNGGA